MIVRAVAIVLLLAAAGGPSRAQDTRIAAIDSLLQAEVDHEHIAGGAIQIVHQGRVLHRAAYGFAQRYRFGMEPLDPPDPLTTEHLFDLASLTKVFGTTFGMMMLVDGGFVDLDAPVRRYLPEFSGPAKDSVTVRHLLTHSSGLSEWEPTYYHAASSEGVLEFIARLPLKYKVGAGRHYSDLGFMLLGFLVERVTGQRLDAFLADNLYDTLGLERTLFRPWHHGIQPSHVAATSHGNPFERRMVYDDSFGYEVDEDPLSWNGWRTYTLRGEVNDGNAFYANGGVAGHAGLFSTLDDLQVLVDLLLDAGSFGDSTLISGEIVRAFTTENKYGNGLGWALAPSVIQSHGAPEGTYGHTGFTGTSVIVMPELDLSIILLSNRQNVGVDASGSYYNLNPTRRKITAITLQNVLP